MLTLRRSLISPQALRFLLLASKSSICLHPTPVAERLAFWVVLASARLCSFRN